MPYKPVIFFASKERVESAIRVPFVKHYIATFPKTYKTSWGATNYAIKQIITEELDSVWQLPGAKKVKND